MSLIHCGSVDDIRSSLWHAEKGYSVKDLWAAIDAESKDKKRVSVIKMLHSAIRRKLKEMDVDQLIAHYPLRDFERCVYVRWPIMEENGKWVAVDVQPNGYYRLAAPTEYDTMQECAAACDASNRFVGFTREQVLMVVKYSNNNGK